MCSFRPPAMGVWPVPDHATVVQIRIRPSRTQIRQNGRIAKRHGFPETNLIGELRHSLAWAMPFILLPG